MHFSLATLGALLLGAVATARAAVSFTAVYTQGDQGSGIGGYDMRSPSDRSFAFDYASTGKLDHIVLYRPGSGTLWILQNIDGSFSSVFAEGAPGNGFYGYDLGSTDDQVMAFDYDSSGKQDHILIYRPGTGTIWIFKHTTGNTFTTVFATGAPGSGIAGYDLMDTRDRITTFDYDHSGKLDHLAIYRPGTGTIWIIKNTNGVFTAVYAQGAPGNGIGGYNLLSEDDKVFAYDYEHSGKQDYLALYRPGTGTIWILKNTGGTFAAVYAQGDPGLGIAGYDLRSTADLIFPFDVEGNINTINDDLVLYRPGSAIWWVVSHVGSAFQAVFTSGSGVGGYDLAWPGDLAYAFDYEGSGRVNYIVLYRPGRGAFWIAKASV